MRRGRRAAAGNGEEDVPWASFADALTGLLFVFILLTVKFVVDAQQKKEEFDAARLAQEEALARLIDAGQRARDLADVGVPGSVARCLKARAATLEARLELIQGTAGTDDAAAISMLLDATESTSVGWFTTGEARLQGEACVVTRAVAQCLSAAVTAPAHPILKPEDTLRVLVEGHTDWAAVLSGPYPSNWELSGARAAALVRALIGSGGDPRCAGEADAAALQAAVDVGKLQLIAVGRADQAPSRAVICQLGGAGDAICACIRGEASTPAARQACEKQALSEGLYAGTTHQQRLVTWANADEGRMRSLRRVDLRFEVRPVIPDSPNAANAAPNAAPNAP
jgi:hypothetical protein